MNHPVSAKSGHCHPSCGGELFLEAVSDIFVDSLDNPRSFYAIHNYGMSLLFGDAGNKRFNRDLLDYFGGARKKDEWLQAHPCCWHDMLEQMVIAGKAAHYNRLNFAFDRDKFERSNPVSLLDSYEIVPTTAAMFSSIAGVVTPIAFWRDVERFLEHVHFTVIIDDEPASTAFTAYRHDDILEIGIETAEKYRGKGLARIACTRLINHCIGNNLEPAWTCRLENMASTNLALRLGFMETKQMPYYQIYA